MVKSGWRKSHLSQFIWSVRANASLSKRYCLGAKLRFWRVWNTYRRVQQVQAAPDRPQYLHLCTWPFFKHYCRSLLTGFGPTMALSCWTKKILRRIAIYPCLRSLNVRVHSRPFLICVAWITSQLGQSNVPPIRRKSPDAICPKKTASANAKRISSLEDNGEEIARTFIHCNQKRLLWSRSLPAIPLKKCHSVSSTDCSECFSVGIRKCACLRSGWYFPFSGRQDYK